ncbi:alpha-2-macroglobulin-like isoform X2 [Osmerus eperlanus]|uniref:alpha-2-macroglobulin-like isoform X2 n=1 Tax=Osmerus eperlanus TaxID=29151 RepID=UPI002E128BFB
MAGSVMDLIKVEVWRWMLLASLLSMCVSQEAPTPAYMVAIPAILPAGSEAKLCTSLLQPNETLVMTISLQSQGENLKLFQETSDKEFHRCFQFQVPQVQKDMVQNIKVEVRGDTFSSTELRKVMIRPSSSMTFVQTDKPIYKPGQKVHFRVVSLDTSFRPANQLYDIVELQDVNSNRIGQWVNTTSNGKILQLSHPLSSEAPKGSYSIVVSTGENKVYHSFKVEHYVLPKFDIKLTMEEEVSIVQEEFKVKLCAMYTYGQPVPGTAEVELCRPLERHHYVPKLITPDNPEGVPEFTAPCHKETLQFDKTGCASLVFNMAIFTKAGEKLVAQHLLLSVKAEEEGTGVSQFQNKRINLSNVIGRYSFIETPKIYEHGTIVKGKVKVVHFNNTPMADQAVYLYEGQGWSPRLLHNLTTDRDGIALFTLNTTNSPKEDIRLIANAKPQGEFNTYRSPYFENGEHTLSVIRPIPAESKTISFLDIQKKDDPLPCGEEEQIKVQYTVVGETVAGGSLDLMYLVLARGAIIQQGVMKAKVQNGPVSDGEVTFKMAVSPDMAPLVQVLVYAVLPSESVIANSIDFPTQKCFNNKVSLQFSPSRAVPGEESSLQLSAQPGSLCGLSAVDQSVLIMEPEGRLNVDKIFQMLPFTKAEAVSYELEDQTGCLHVRPKRYVYPGYREREEDAYSVFQKLGLKMATNLIMRLPLCLKFKGRDYHRGYVVSYRQNTHLQRGMPMASPGRSVVVPMGAAATPPPIQTVRTFFPETWIWDLVEVGASGSEDIALTVPDTITTWETEVFCLSSEGLGLAPPLELNVFQPFFLELSLPYSIIRGELLELTATVFNYLPSCIMVSVNPAPSLDYTLTPIPGVEYSSCLCANGRNTFRWTMTPLVLGALNVSVSAEAVASHASCDNEIVSVPERGRIDVVTRSLLVKAEGTEQTNTYNWLLCPAGESLKEEVDIKLPEEVIDGSARASLSVLGDILGRAMQNLDGLLRMPYGCGEQNMALLAPNIYILEYLRNTEQLTTAILDKAKGFLTSGYQRQLNYKHYDGAYSTFGQGAGNTWLTAFVLRAFGRAKSFIYIDPQVIEISKLWLENRQEPDGSFMQMGKLFNNRMKGGVSDEVTFTAYVTASLLELNNSVSDPFVAKSLSYLRKRSTDVSNTYTTALLAYTFSLAGDMETRSRLLQHLDKVASHQGGFLYWSQSSSTTSASLSVEISSYVLLASLSSPSVSTADLGYASRIVRWLVRQQNPYGGFASTQDTVVALQALALYSTKVFSPEGSSSVSVQSPGGEVQVFDINQNNKLLYQEKALPALAGQYSIEVKGTACATVQVAVHYNVPTPTDNSTLKIQVIPEIDCSSNALRPRLSLKLQSLYSGKEQTTNMVIVDLKMLSGFVPDPQSLTELKTALLVDRVETKDDHVLMYLRELISGAPINHSLDIIQELPVQKLKPAVVQIYDYYQPSDQAETEYIYPCAADV